MKAVILAGGFGTRLSEETVTRPKPMVEIGGRPILWHIMSTLSVYGVREFIIALGYKSNVIKEYFLNFNAMNSDLSVDLGTGDLTIHDGDRHDWQVHLVDTGLHTQTGGRLRRVRDWIGDESFLFTYGDGLTDLNVGDLIEFHRKHGKLATVTTVRSPARFGRIGFDGERVTEFYEKPEAGDGWINGGYFILEPGAIDYVDGDNMPWERDPVMNLGRDGQLMGFRHYGFWSCMDTQKEKNLLDEMWKSGNVPWKVW